MTDTRSEKTGTLGLVLEIVKRIGEPTACMVQAGVEALYDAEGTSSSYRVRSVFEAMLRQALIEAQEETRA